MWLWKATCVKNHIIQLETFAWSIPICTSYIFCTRILWHWIWVRFVFNAEAQENADEYSNEVEQLRGAVARNEEEKQRLEAELLQVKEMLQREVARADAESRRSNVIIAEYKQVLIHTMLQCSGWPARVLCRIARVACFRSANAWRTTTMPRRRHWANYECVTFQ